MQSEMHKIVPGQLNTLEFEVYYDNGKLADVPIAGLTASIEVDNGSLHHVAGTFEAVSGEEGTPGGVFYLHLLPADTANFQHTGSVIIKTPDGCQDVEIPLTSAL